MFLRRPKQARTRQSNRPAFSRRCFHELVQSEHGLAVKLTKSERVKGAGMPLEFTTSYLKDSLSLFRYYKTLSERAMAQVSDEGLFVTLDEESNSIAIIVKHMAGNMRSRWTDFLTTDGEKPDRNRDAEFEDAPRTRAELVALWEKGWKHVFDALAPLTDADLTRQVTIRSE